MVKQYSPTFNLSTTSNYNINQMKPKKKAVRRALIGLSSPIFYDYSQQGERLSSELYSSPNPILDGAYGLFFLYDEIWFLTRCLCPRNMRNASFVRFLDEEVSLTPEILDAKVEHPEYFFSKYQVQRFKESVNSYWPTVTKVGINWEASPDIHTHGINVAGAHVSANSMREINVIKDIALVTHLRDKSFELITNTFTQNLFDRDSKKGANVALTQELVIDHIPNYLDKFGPYHPCVEECRQSRYLADFRKWIAEHPCNLTTKEINETKRAVETEIATLTKNILGRYWEPKQQFRTFGKTILGLIPTFSDFVSVIDLIEQLKEARNSNRTRWQGFLLDLKQRGRKGDI